LSILQRAVIDSRGKKIVRAEAKYVFSCNTLEKLEAGKKKVPNFTNKEWWSWKEPLKKKASPARSGCVGC